MDLDSVNSRSKAAAWAWYQRSSGSLGTRSEVALAAQLHRGVRRGCPSRFKLEADLLLSDTPIQAISDRLESLHLSIDSSNSSSDGPIDRNDLLMVPPSTSMAVPIDRNDILMVPPSTSMQQMNGLPRVCTDLVLAGSSSYGAAAWDCGSALFDSFELVAMSKKLDDAHQLNHTTVEKVCRPPEGAGVDAQFETGLDADEVDESLDNHKLAALHTVALTEDSDTVKLSPDLMQSRQAIYDMFCRYDDPQPQKGIFSEDVSSCNHEHKRKPTPAMSPVAHSKQNRRRRLHSLSRTLRQRIAGLAGHSRASSTSHRRPPDKPLLNHSLSLPADKPLLNQSLSLPAEAPAQLQRQSHSLPLESAMAHLHPRSLKTAHAGSPQAGIKSMGSPFRECPPSESCAIKALSHTLRKQYSSDSGHHHYHHHYHHHHHHYLFRRHSDEGFTTLPEPLLGADKSLLVAAAGLRMAKISSLQDYLSLNPKLEGALLDYKRKLKDANMSNASPIQSPASPSLHV